jgi:hypothetical protein
MDEEPLGCPVRADQVITQRVGDSTLLLHLETGRYFDLNEIGSRIWELADGTRPLSQIVATIRNEYEAPTDQVAGDVSALITEMVRARLVHIGMVSSPLSHAP